MKKFPRIAINSLSCNQNCLRFLSPVLSGWRGFGLWPPRSWSSCLWWWSSRSYCSLSASRSWCWSLHESGGINNTIFYVKHNVTSEYYIWYGLKIWNIFKFSKDILKSHLFDVGAALTNYIFVKLLEDGNGQWEAVLNLENERKLLWSQE